MKRYSLNQLYLGMTPQIGGGVFGVSDENRFKAYRSLK